jgi:hypothetical protein
VSRGSADRAGWNAIDPSPSYLARRRLLLAGGGFHNAGLRANQPHQHRRHGLDDRRNSAGADDDDTGPGAVLFGHGAQEERARDHGAEPCGGGSDFDPLGGVRLFAGLLRRRVLARHPRPLVSYRHDHGQRQSGRKDDSGSALHALPDDLRDHHCRAGCRLRCRPHAIFSLSPVFNRLVHVRLRSARTLDLGRRLPRLGWRARFRWRPRCASCRRSTCRSP